MRRTRLLLALAVMPCLGFSFLPTLQLQGAEPGGVWPQFRGPGARGVAAGDRLPITWSRDKNIVWRRPLPGQAWSSPIVWEDKVFVTNARSLGQEEEPKQGLYFGGERSKPSPNEHVFSTVCLDFETGRVLWEKVAYRGRPAVPRHIKNSYASQTPCTDGKRVYAYFGNQGLLLAYDFNGQEIWRRTLPVHRTRFNWGSAASPVVHDNRLIIVDDNEEDSAIMAFDTATGKTLWRTPRDEKSNWATPFVWENKLRTEIVTAGTGANRSYDLEGRLLWSLRGMSVIAIPTPFAVNDLLYICSGYVGDKHKPVYAVRPGAQGDITLPPAQTSSEWIAWYRPRIGPYNPSPVVYKDQLYVLLDFGFLTSYDARTGKTIYDKQRFRRSRTAFTSSPWAYRDRIFCLSESGDTFVVEAGPTFKVVATNRLDEMCMATPAIAGDSLILRTREALYRIAEHNE